MYIRVLKKHARFVPGQEFTATRQLAMALIEAGVAKQIQEPAYIPRSKVQEVEPDDISKAITKGIKEAIKTTPVKKTPPKTVKKKTPPKKKPIPEKRK